MSGTSASASITAFPQSGIIFLTASSVASSFPRPMPMTTTSCFLISSEITGISFSTSLSPVSGRTIRLGEKEAMMSDTFLGAATVAISTPPRSAARAARAGAPEYAPPPITRTLPASPLWLVAGRVRNCWISPGPTKNSASRGTPISMT
ncbi:Uncharacterised protein [uncultured archaeon]|nr:Uncharacterised protein [uncultured archaeon]